MVRGPLWTNVRNVSAHGSHNIRLTHERWPIAIQAPNDINDFPKERTWCAANCYYYSLLLLLLSLSFNRGIGRAKKRKARARARAATASPATVCVEHYPKMQPIITPGTPAATPIIRVEKRKREVGEVEWERVIKIGAERGWRWWKRDRNTIVILLGRLFNRGGAGGIIDKR